MRRSTKAIMAAISLLAADLTFAGQWTSETGERCDDSSEQALYVPALSRTMPQASVAPAMSSSYADTGATDGGGAVPHAVVPAQAMPSESEMEGLQASDSPVPELPISEATAEVAITDRPVVPGAVAEGDAAPTAPDVCFPIDAGQSIASAFQSWDKGQWQTLWEYSDDVYAEVDTCVRGPYEMAVRRVVEALREGGGVPIKVTTHINPDFDSKVLRITGA